MKKNVVALGLWIAGGCLAADLGVSGTAEAAVVANRLAVNKLAGNRIAGNRLASNRLASNKLAGNRLASNRVSANLLGADDLLSTADGREVLAYLVSCALPSRHTLVATVEGTTYEFPGGVGLAPRWMHRRLRMSERRWISACMLARVNAHGVSVTISMRGMHPALRPTRAEAAGFRVVEGAFWGDVFSDGDAFVAYACRGADQAAGETGSLVDRDCTEPAATGETLCGFTDAGDCADFSGRPWACAGEREGQYVRCHDQPGLGAWPETAPVREVITVFLAGAPAGE